MKNPICPYCETQMEIINFEGYFESFPYWSCVCRDSILEKKSKITRKEINPEIHETVNFPHKIVAKITQKSLDEHNFIHGNIGSQWKKKEYVSTIKFNRCSPELITRWKQLGFEIEIFILQNNKWRKK